MPNNFDCIVVAILRKQRLGLRLVVLCDRVQSFAASARFAVASRLMLTTKTTQSRWRLGGFAVFIT